MYGRVKVCLEYGLTSSPVMRIADLTQQHNVCVRIRRVGRSEWVAGDNPMEIMLLEAERGSELECEVTGEHDVAEEAMRQLAQIVSNSSTFERIENTEAE